MPFTTLLSAQIAHHLCRQSRQSWPSVARDSDMTRVMVMVAVTARSKLRGQKKEAASSFCPFAPVESSWQRRLASCSVQMLRGHPSRSESGTSSNLTVLTAARALRAQVPPHELRATPPGRHLGRDKTLALTRRSVWWPGLPAAVKKYVRACPKCKRVTCPRGAFSHVVAYTRQTSALRGTVDTLLDATSYCFRWVLLSPDFICVNSVYVKSYMN